MQSERVADLAEGDEPELPVVSEHFVAGSSRLYVFFGGLQGRLGIKTFEFMRSAEVLDCSHLFLRDPYRAWYQRGLPSIADDVHGLAAYLKDRIAASGATEIRFVGNCMGGFAAILICGLLRRGQAIAFAPQSLLEAGAIEPHGGDLVAQSYAGMYAHRTSRHIYDLPAWLRGHCPDLRAAVYAGTASRIDMAHARTLEGFENIQVHYVQNIGHGVVRLLRHQGRLKEILSA